MWSTPFTSQKRNTDALYSSSANGKDFASPLTAPPATRVKYYSTQVDEKLAVLLQELGPRKTTNDTAAQMLRGMIPGCLGPAVSARDDLQERACEIVGSELDQMEKEYIHAINIYDDMMHKLSSNLEMRLAARQDHDITQHTTSETSLIQELEQLRGQLTKLRQREAEAGRDISADERQIKELKERISQLMALYHNHYEPLRANFAGTCQYHVPKLRSLGGCEWLSPETENLRRMARKYEEMSETLEKLEDLRKHEQMIEALKKLEGLLKKQGEQGSSWISDEELKKLISELQRFQKAKEIIEELKTSENLPTQTRKSKIQMLIQLFNGLDCEDCLVAGFEPAALEPPSKRGPWSNKVFETLEKVIDEKLSDIRGKIGILEEGFRRRLQELIEDFESRLQDLKAKIGSQEADLLSRLELWIQSLVNDPKNRLSDLESAYDGKKLTLQELVDEIRRLTEQEPGLVEEINKRRKQTALLEKMRLKWEALVKTVRTRITSIQAEKTKITTALESFRAGPLAAYKWLLQHSNPDYSTIAEDSSVGGYEPEVVKNIRVLDHPVKHLQDRSTKSKEMIFCSAPGCLCPAFPQRRLSQADQCLLVGKALKCQEEALLKIVDTHFKAMLELGAPFSPNLLQVALEAGIDTDGGTAVTTFTNLVAEVDEARKKASLHHSNMVKAQTDAETGLKAAKRDYDAAVTALQTAENLIRTHFIPPRDSETMVPLEADQHISHVLSFLKQQWKLEECLLGGLGPALKHRPSERGIWCVGVIEETEKQMDEKLALLRQDVENKNIVVRDQADKLEAAKREAETALKEKENAEKLYQLVRELLEKVKNLISFRLTVLAAYQWLHMRGSSDRAMDHGPLLAITIKEFDLEVEAIEIVETVTTLDFKDYKTCLDFKDLTPF